MKNKEVEIEYKYKNKELLLKFWGYVKILLKIENNKNRRNNYGFYG